MICTSLHLAASPHAHNKYSLSGITSRGAAVGTARTATGLCGPAQRHRPASRPPGWLGGWVAGWMGEPPDRSPHQFGVLPQPPHHQIHGRDGVLGAVVASHCDGRGGRVVRYSADGPGRWDASHGRVGTGQRLAEYLGRSDVRNRKVSSTKLIGD